MQIKNFNSIVASMINNASGGSSPLTDFNVGSVARTIFEAVGREIDQYYQQLLKGFYESVPVAIYKTFSFGKLPAAGSSGYVTFTRETGNSADITIPAGTRVGKPGANFTYVAVDNVILAAGSTTVDVFVAASATGLQTNCIPNTITQLIDTIDGIASVTNQGPFANGKDEETPDERKERFQRWLNTLARSTKAAIEYGASTAKLVDASGSITERVSKVVTYEACIDADPIGLAGSVDVYIWNGSTGASNELIQETLKILYGYTDDNGVKIPGWKAAGVVVTVKAVILTPVNITATITLDGSRAQADVDSDMKTAIGNLFGALDIGEDLIWSKLVQTVMQVSGVGDVNFTTPTQNVAAGDWNRICSLGNISLTYL